MSVLTMQATMSYVSIYYPDGEPTIEPTGQRYLFGGKEREHAGGRNTYDFGARSLTPYGRWGVVDPLTEKYYSFSPYSYCAGDPINRVDSNGMEWTITESKDGTSINFHITGVVINTSVKDFDLNKVAKAIENQLKDVYTFSNSDISVTMTAEIRAVTSADDIKDTDHVFRIQDQSSFRKGELANAMTPGLNIRLGTKLVEETLSGENTRTIAHEVGHSGGLSHTNLTERTLPIYDMNTNLMTKIEDLNRGADKNKATMLQTNQINEIVKMYRRGKLNHGSPLRKRYNPQRLSTWPYITLTSKYLCR